MHLPGTGRSTNMPTIVTLINGDFLSYLNRAFLPARKALDWASYGRSPSPVVLRALNELLRKRIRRASSHGLTTAIPAPSKSRTLRVANFNPCDCAMAAIWQSDVEIGRPASRHCEPMPANAWAALLSNGRIRRSKVMGSISSISARSFDRLRPGGAVAAPRRSSASPIAEKYKFLL